MTTILLLIFVVSIAYSSFMFVEHLKNGMRYKQARISEIKRRLQVEHKNEVALQERLKQPLDDNDRLKLLTRFAHERHQRAIHYVIQDTLEKWR